MKYVSILASFGNADFMTGVSFLLLMMENYNL